MDRSPVCALEQQRALAAGGTLPGAANAAMPNHPDPNLAEANLAATIESTGAAERALLNAEKKYRDLFDGALEGMFQTSLDGQALSANGALARMLGYDSPEDLISSVRDLAKDVWANPDDRTRYLKQLEERGAILGLECQFKRKDGTLMWVSINTRKVCGADGRILHLEGFIEDITERRRIALALAESEARLRATFEGTGSVILLIDQSDSTIVAANPAASTFYGYAHEQLIGMSIWLIDTLPPDEIALVRERMAREDRTFYSLRHRLASGEVRDVEVYPSPVIADGKPLMFSIVHDVTERKRAETRLRESEERYRTAFQTSLDAITISRMSDGTYIECNHAFQRIVGYEHSELIGKSSLELGIWADKRDREKHVGILRRNGNFRDLEMQLRRKSGELFWGLMSASMIELDGESCLMSVMRDISEAKQAVDEIRNLSFYDPLTRLPNRRLLLERLRQTQGLSFRNHRKRALLFVDMDDFKTLNDTLGHETGDQLLKEVSVRLAACTRDGDTLARLGGDEFVIMLEDLSDVAEVAAAEAKAVAENVLATLAKPYSLAGRECLCTSSVGITVFGDQRDNGDRVLQQADIAMYQAKSAGRNTMRFFSPALQAAVNARAALEEDLRQAIRAGDFLLYFQPQMRLGQCVGAEALVRWRHSVRGILLPGEFIPLAEETGLILRLGSWVMESACLQIAAWSARAETAALTLAVNISVRQLRQPNFVDEVLAALKRTGADPHKIKLELTESMLVDNIEDVIAKMTILNSHGLRFSLDDFGTGYSSLSYLKRLPLDQLKIDRSFVRDILADASSGAIAQTIVSLSHAMGLSVIAEGVETEEQREFLAQLGCETFQGYLFGRPVPLEDFELQLAAAALRDIPVAP